MTVDLAVSVMAMVLQVVLIVVTVMVITGGDKGAGSDGRGSGIAGDSDSGCSSGNETSRGVSLPSLRLRDVNRPSGMSVPKDYQNSGEQILSRASSHRRRPEQWGNDALPSSPVRYMFPSWASGDILSNLKHVSFDLETAEASP